MTYVLLIAAGALLCLSLWFLRTVRFIGQVSTGNTIAPSGRTALLLIDLQSCFWVDDTYDSDTKQRVETAVRRSVETAKQTQIPVIALRQEWSTPSTKFLAKLLMGGKAIAGDANNELAAPFTACADQQIIKRVQDGFETQELNEALQQLQIDHLQIAGLDGLYCVNKTSQAALLRGYKVELIKDGIATTDPAKFDQVLQDLKAQGARLI